MEKLQRIRLKADERSTCEVWTIHCKICASIVEVDDHASEVQALPLPQTFAPHHHTFRKAYEMFITSAQTSTLIAMSADQAFL